MSDRERLIDDAVERWRHVVLRPGRHVMLNGREPEFVPVTDEDCAWLAEQLPQLKGLCPEVDPL